MQSEAAKQLQSLKKYVIKPCEKCGVVYQGYAKTTLCRKCYNSEWVKQNRAKAKKSL